MSDDRYVDHEGHRIQPKVHQEKGSLRWMAGEYHIGWGRGAKYVEKLFVHDVQYFDTEAEARQVTIRLAKETIARGKVEG